MARGVRFTKVESGFLRNVLGVLSDESGTYDWSCFGTKVVPTAVAILAKLDAAEGPKPVAGIDLKPVEAAFERTARGKFVRLETGHAMASKRGLALGVTPETAELVGSWMGRQGWLTGPMTILDIFNKWHQWLPRARATEPPPELSPGLGTDDTRPRPAGERKTPPRGGSTPGFR